MALDWQADDNAKGQPKRYIAKTRSVLTFVKKHLLYVSPRLSPSFVVVDSFEAMRRIDNAENLGIRDSSKFVAS